MAQITIDINKARLRTRIDHTHDMTTVIHTITDDLEDKTIGEVCWRRKQRLGAGGYGEVYLQERVNIDNAVEKDSTSGHKGNEDPGRPRLGALRAVKEVTKWDDRTELPELCQRELQGLLFFTHSKVRSALCQSKQP